MNWIMVELLDTDFRWLDRVKPKLNQNQPQNLCVLKSKNDWLFRTGAFIYSVCICWTMDEQTKKKKNQQVDEHLRRQIEQANDWNLSRSVACRLTRRTTFKNACTKFVMWLNFYHCVLVFVFFFFVSFFTIHVKA